MDNLTINRVLFRRMENSRYDLVVIGGGPAGYTAALNAAESGLRVALVEKGHLGGVCLNNGCIPTKTMLASSSLYWKMRNAAEFGLSAERISVDYGSVINRRNKVINKLASGIRTLLVSKKIDCISGEATFTGQDKITVSLNDSKMLDLSFAYALIATGSESIMPEIFPAHPRVVDSTSFLNLSQLPNRLLIVGGGVLGCEFAILAAQFGSKVTIIEQKTNILPDIDDDVRDVLLGSFGELGINIVTGASVHDIETDDDGIYAMAGQEEVYGDIMLVATGRRPVLTGLNLEVAGVEYTPDGIRIDKHCRTSSAKIFAAGDVVCGSSQLANEAMMQGRVAAESIIGHTVERDTLIPSCIFTMPEIAHAGFSERCAAKDGLKVRVEKTPFTYNGMAQAIGETNGFVKKLYSVADDRQVGITIIGPHASELIAGYAGTVIPHPTLAEVLTK